MPETLHRRKLILVGCGPHYQNRYHSLLEEKQADIMLLIDLRQNRESIIQFFEHKKLKPRQMLFLEEAHRNALSQEELDHLIPQSFNFSEADAVLICTEPKARKTYVQWSLSHNLPVFMDKPSSAFTSINHAANLLKDFNEVESMAIWKNLDAVVSCERRDHPGYCWVFEFLKNFIKKYRVPITSIDIHFAGGVWNLPQEYIHRENHPFKYGYGILLHSGYHYVDLLVKLLSLNRLLTQGRESERTLELMVSTPKDQIPSIGACGYSYLLAPQEIEKSLSPDFLKQFSGFGETDVILIGQDSLEGLVSNFSLKILGTSLCLRKHSKFSPELKGKVRQEHVIIHLGPFCSIHISSNPSHKLDPANHPIEEFNITVMTSPLIQEVNPIIRLNREEISELFPEIPRSASLNGHSRKQQLLNFLQKKQGNSSLSSHKETVAFIQKIYTKLLNGPPKRAASRSRE